jgi:hypothetical protein
MRTAAEPPPSHATALSRAESWDAMLRDAGLSTLRKKTSDGHKGGSPWAAMKKSPMCFKHQRE